MLHFVRLPRILSIFNGVGNRFGIWDHWNGYRFGESVHTQSIRPIISVHAEGIQMTENLPATLQRLHEELSKAPRLAPSTLEELRVLANDIQRVLDSQSQEDADEPTEGSESAIPNRIQALIESFESHHPQLTKTLSMIAERLSDMGI